MNHNVIVIFQYLNFDISLNYLLAIIIIYLFQTDSSSG